jgi:hypothetical protein
LKNAYTRTAKAGIYDERAIELLRIARTKPDARTMTSSYTDASGKEVVRKTEGMDLVGRNIGHIYEQIPDIRNALKQYREVLRADRGKGALPSDEKMKMLLAAGEYWAATARFIRKSLISTIRATRRSKRKCAS